MTRKQILKWCEECVKLPCSYDDGGYTSTSSYHVREWPNGDRYEYRSTQDHNTNIETVTVNTNIETVTVKINGETVLTETAKC